MPEAPPVERINEAIAKLGRLKDDSAPGPWTTQTRALGWEVVSPEHGTIITTGYVGNNDAKPHATVAMLGLNLIEVQIDLLRSAAEMKGVYLKAGGQWSSTRFGHGVLALADAVLKEQPEWPGVER